MKSLNQKIYIEFFGLPAVRKTTISAELGKILKQNTECLVIQRNEVRKYQGLIKLNPYIIIRSFRLALKLTKADNRIALINALSRAYEIIRRDYIIKRLSKDDLNCVFLIYDEAAINWMSTFGVDKIGFDKLERYIFPNFKGWKKLYVNVYLDEQTRKDRSKKRKELKSKFIEIKNSWKQDTIHRTKDLKFMNSYLMNSEDVYLINIKSSENTPAQIALKIREFLIEI